MTDRSAPREFPDPRDIHGRLVRSETKIDGLTETVNSIDVKVDALKAHIDIRSGAAGLAQHLGIMVMMVCSAVVGAVAAGLMNWLHR